MSELVLAPISKLAEINPGRESVDLESDDEVSFIPMGDLTESGHWVGSQTRQYGNVRNGFTFFREGDVLFAKITPCMENGKGCLVGELTNNVGFGSTEFHVLRAKDQSDSGYIHQWLLYPSLRRSASNVMVGSAGQQRVPAKFFDEYHVPFFPKPEQAKIAEVLSTVDRAIEQTEALIAKQQRIKAGLLQDLLTRGIDEHGNLRSEATHAFKDSPLGRIPVEWEVKVLSAYTSTEITYGIVQAGPHIPGGVPYVRTGDMSGNSLLSEYMLCTSHRIAMQFKRSEIHQGELVMAIRATVGKVLPVPQSLDGANLTQGTARIAPNEATDPEFLMWAIRHDRARREILNEVKGTTFAEITLTALRKVRIAAPSQKIEQHAIGRKLSSIESDIENELAFLAKLRSLKTALMQDLLTGKKRVTPLLNDKRKEISAVP